MDTAALADVLCTRLAVQGSAERAEGERRYLRSDLTHLGVGMPALRRTTRRLLREQRLALPERLALAGELWRRPTYELRQAAVQVLERSKDELDTAHLALIERMVREAHTWALVDPLATDVAGTIAASHPGAQSTLDRWIADDLFWMRRAALLAHLRPVRRDPSRFDVFAAHADRVLDEREFFIRKAIGWVLREAGKVAPQRVVEWLEPRIPRVSGVTIREAVKYLPDADAERLMLTYRSRR
jgi:3-methyladenine DNA glycosylase AlkD